ncbi:MAG: hypothetical protein ACLFVO_19315 [Chloroflexaceae bacterium]
MKSSISWTTGAAFFPIGVMFLVLGMSVDSTFFAVGVPFLILGIVGLPRKQRPEVEDEE